MCQEEEELENQPCGEIRAGFLEEVIFELLI